MSLHHSTEIHRTIIERLPRVTGRDLAYWLTCLDLGPGLLRFGERVSWLRDAHELPHGYAAAIVHEADLRRAELRMAPRPLATS